MDLALIWDKFAEHLQSFEGIEDYEMKKIAGIPFIYIKAELPKEELEDSIKRAAAKSIRGKRLHSETVYVRKRSEYYVYRHRFYVPQEKMFCCGNLCVDCIRLRG
ncbi:hypothetical protein FZC84_14790 [Rossellomorea vietnamensis]|uniref:Uncharacterized protein n=1 Tax=Rossellomorea vietnamensis TaxID=218284 RepID=A0A5D4MAC2_9BACI|nr:hypothetical protein [Rossellomorea vietnamensis]TYR98438.1 hypothetical protein FZC84_14790 [Rossellomorea vietnamensis]